MLFSLKTESDHVTTHNTNGNTAIAGSTVYDAKENFCEAAVRPFRTTFLPDLTNEDKMHILSKSGKQGSHKVSASIDCCA